MKRKIIKGDEVIVRAGSSKGQTGKVEQVDQKNNRVYIAGVNLGVKHKKPSAENKESGLIEKVMPVHLSNVAIVDPKSGQPTRVGFKVSEGKRVRFAKRSGSLL